MSVGGFYIFRISEDSNTDKNDTDIVALVLYNQTHYFRIPIEPSLGILEEDLVFIEKFIVGANMEEKEKEERLKKREGSSLETEFGNWFLH